MTRSLKAAFPLLPVVWLCACTAPPIYPVPPMAQQLAPSDSILGEACDGHDPSAGLRLSGHTLLVVRVDVSTLAGAGNEVPYARIAAPAGEGISQMARPAFSGHPGPEACGGTAVWTVVRRENGVLYLDWRLEVAPPGGSGTLPAEPWRITGRAPVDQAFGHQMVARLTAAPGPVFVADQHRREAAEAAARHPYPMFAAPLPDERPYRTLDDVTNPGFQR